MRHLSHRLVHLLRQRAQPRRVAIVCADAQGDQRAKLFAGLRSVVAQMLPHKVKPGITGWAQVNGLQGATDTLDAMKARVEHDLWYIDNWSLGLDLKIIALTVSRLWFDRNAY
jgi:lipopolysaccharide/colanic/teichoic acid biosynthesis glycosyltransferase